jgi:hypothetical protein
VVVPRRAALDLSTLAARTNGAAAPAPAVDAEGDEEASPLDVPAFLRRHEG